MMLHGSHAPSAPVPIWRSLYFQVIVGVILGILLGHFAPSIAEKMKPFGDLFIKLVKMMIAPVVFCTIVGGIASSREKAGVGKTVLKAMTLFYILTILALFTGLVSIEAIRPGVGLNIDPNSFSAADSARYAKSAGHVDLVEMLLHIIPNTFFGPFAEGETLPVLFIAIMTGIGLAKAGEAGRPFLNGLEAFQRAIFLAFAMMMKLAPLGAFGALSYIVARNGLRSIGNLGGLILTLYVASLFFVFVILNILARIHGFSLWKVLRYFREELLVVLGTSSTEPVLPQMLLKLERLGCDKRSVGLTLPLGYSFNLDGTAIYLTLATLFLAQAMNIELSVGHIASLIGVMLLTSKGAAGVTGSGFAALVATLAAFPGPGWVPVVGVVLIAGIDRFMSEARALTSMVSNAVGCIVISIWDGACDKAVLLAELDRGNTSPDQVFADEAAAPAARTGAA